MTAAKKKKILIVEDEESLREVLEDMFEKQHFLVLSGENGEEGLYKALQSHPDIILTDIVMPKMDGVEMIKRLKKDEWGATVPIIVLTNLSDRDNLKTLTEIGISDYLLKADWSIGAIVEKVNETLGK